jgi:nucleotide-binding universal stress UspA family protein
MKILVAVDGSEHTKHMLAYWVAHEELLGPAHSYTVLVVVQALPALMAGALDRSAVQGYYADEGERILHPIREFLDRKHLPVTYLSRTGSSVADVIASTAEAGGFDLLLMGSHGHGAVGARWLGSVVSRVLAACGVPVLVIR